SRLNSVLEDFHRYKKDPTGYKPHAPAKERAARPASPKPRPGDAPKRSIATDATDDDDELKTEEIDFPIPIRKGVIVTVSGIPADLTPEEATKIGAVILALSGSQER